MRDIRVYVDRPLTTNSEVSLPPSAAHHVARVLRLKPEQPLILFNGRGGQYRAVIDKVNHRTVQVRIGEHENIERESPLRITLVQGVSRGKHMDYTLQKAVELGVAAIVPVLSEQGQVRLAAGRAASKQDHWRGIVISACEQCGRNRVPELQPPLAFADWLSQSGNTMPRLLLDPLAGRHLRELPAPAGQLLLISGPEGGFSTDEREQVLAVGCIGIGLGPRVLRTETAAPAAIMACQALWGDLG